MLICGRGASVERGQDFGAYRAALLVFSQSARNFVASRFQAASVYVLQDCGNAVHAAKLQHDLMSAMGGKRSLGSVAVPSSMSAKRTGDGDGETQSGPDIGAP